MLPTLPPVGARALRLPPYSATKTLPTAYSQTRSVSSSPYGRTHVWKRRQKKLPNPVVPMFPQRVIRSDGSSFVHFITSPRSLIRLTRDVTNAPLWNVDLLASEGAQDESATAGRLGRFNRRFAEDVGMDWISEADSKIVEEKKAKEKGDSEKEKKKT